MGVGTILSLLQNNVSLVFTISYHGRSYEWRMFFFFYSRVALQCNYLMIYKSTRKSPLGHRDQHKGPCPRSVPTARQTDRHTDLNCIVCRTFCDEDTTTNRSEPHA